MLQFALRRLLSIPPTFFVIALILFLVLNLAPGRPTQTGSEDDKGGVGGCDLFCEQFNLDKPILLNARFLLDTADVREWLVTAGGLDPGASAAERLEAATTLADYGNDLVPHLVALLDDPTPEIRSAAVARLPVAARLRVPDDRRGGEKAEIDRISAINGEVAEWRIRGEADEALVAERASTWKAWYPEHRGDYELSGAAATVGDLLTDTRFARYLRNLFSLDFGISTVDRRPVIETIRERATFSICLSGLSIVLAYLLAVPIGIFSAVRRGTTIDTVVTVALFLMFSLPSFFTGTVLLQWLSVGDPFTLFPTGGFSSNDGLDRTTIERMADVLWHLALPIFTQTSITVAALSRYARVGVIDVINSDYVRTARAKGLPELTVIVKHAARNGMIPVLTLLGGLLPALISGSVVVEVVFGIPGMGSYLVDAINQRDYNAVMGVLLVSSFLTLIGLFLSDLSYALVDPRINLD